MKLPAGIPMPLGGRADSDLNTAKEAATYRGDGFAFSDSQRTLTGARRAIVQRLDRRIYRSMDLDSTLGITLQELGQHLGVDRCVLWLMDGSGRQARAGYQFCAPSTKPLPDSPIRLEFREMARTINSEGALVV